MTPQQFYGWYRDHDFLHEPRVPRRETWLVKRLREKERPQATIGTHSAIVTTHCNGRTIHGWWAVVDKTKVVP